MRTAMISSVPQPLGTGPVIRLQRSITQGIGTLVAGSPFLSQVSLSMSTLPSAFKTFLLTFDLFRFRSIRVQWIPNWNVSDAGASIPQIATAPNYDDTNPASSYDYVLGQRGAKYKRFDSPMSQLVSPRSLGSSQVTSGSAPYVALHNGWMNTGAVSFTVVFPLAKYAVTASPLLPGDGTFSVYLDLDIELVQPTTG